MVSLWFPNEGNWWATKPICETPGDRPIGSYTTRDFADIFSDEVNQYGHARFYQYHDELLYGLADHDEYVLFTVHTPEQYITGECDDSFVSDEDFEVQYGMPKVLYFYGPDPDSYPGWLWDFVHEHRDLADKIGWTTEVVAPAIYDAILDHKQEIANITADVARDVAHDLGYESVPKMVGAAVRRALEALPFRNIIDAIPLLRRQPDKLLPWRGSK